MPVGAGPLFGSCNGGTSIAPPEGRPAPAAGSGFAVPCRKPSHCSVASRARPNGWSPVTGGGEQVIPALLAVNSALLGAHNGDPAGRLLNPATMLGWDEVPNQWPGQTQWTT